MPNPADGLTSELSSSWDGLSNHLIAAFYEVDRQGRPLKDQDGNPVNVVVRAPLTESNLDASLNWQSAFESMSPETKAPMLFAMLQSGAIQPVIDSLNATQAGKLVSKFAGTEAGNAVSGNIASAQQRSGDFLKQFEGRTGITKLNSTQIFSGMPPVKIQVTALFRAWRDPVSEVETPVNQLMTWALPEKLANDSLIANTVKSVQDGSSLINALLPSQSPHLIAMRYKNLTLGPMVIEAIGYPLSSPIDSRGHFTELLIPMTLCSLTAWDREDWAKTRYSNDGRAQGGSSVYEEFANSAVRIR